MKVPWTARRSNQSILKEISPEYSLEGLMLKLNLQYFGHLLRRTDSSEKTLMEGFPGGSTGKESACNAGDLCSIPGLGRSPGGESMATHSSILAWEIPTDRGAWRATVHEVTKSQTRLSD